MTVGGKWQEDRRICLKPEEQVKIVSRNLSDPENMNLQESPSRVALGG